MSARSANNEAPVAVDLDPRWQLVERIVSSQCFAKSERLSSFLTCVCDLTRRGEQEQINEQYIGTTVFGRRPDYDPGADSIVRSHASRLRHRLTQYFAEEGAGEEWMLTIPKGSYLPVFHFRSGSHEAVAVEDADRMARLKPFLPETIAPAPAIQKDDTSENEVRHSAISARDRYLVPVLSGALVLVTIIALVCGAAILSERRTAAISAGSISESKRLFWGHLFSAKDQTIVVIADSGLVMLQGVTKQRVTLPMYLNGTYLQTIPHSSSSAETWNLATRRYTSIVDLTIMSKILRMTGVDLDNTKFVYSRDLRPSQIKQGNIILLGPYESTPWVQLFEPGMNFYFQNDLAAASSRSSTVGQTRASSLPTTHARTIPIRRSTGLWRIGHR